MEEVGMTEKVLIFGKTKVFYKIEAMVKLDDIKEQKVIKMFINH